MKILVVGSISMDLVGIGDKRPNKGETVIGNEFKTTPGGKGANQAVAAVRLASKDVTVEILGKVGNDDFGLKLKENLTTQNILTGNIETVNNSSGIALILLAEKDNSIMVITGANGEVSKEYIDKNKDVILNSDMIVLQLEIPFDTVKHIINICYENKKPIILNPAPAIKLDKELINKLTYLTPNEHECRIILDDYISPIEELLKKYPNKLIMTVGEEGVVYSDGEKIIKVKGYKVDVVDTTGAGDTFNGALAVSLIQNKKLNEAIKFANASAALSVTKFGAQNGMPNLEEVNKLLN